MNGRNVHTGVCILAENLPEMVGFYRDTLGFETDWDGGDFAEFFTAGARLSFFMYSRKEFAKAIGEEFQPPRGINQTFEIGMWLDSYAAVDREYEKLSTLPLRFPAGAPVTYPFGIRNFYVADPEGNLLEIGSDNPGDNLQA